MPGAPGVMYGAHVKRCMRNFGTEWAERIELRRGEQERKAMAPNLPLPALWNAFKRIANAKKLSAEEKNWV